MKKSPKKDKLITAIQTVSAKEARTTAYMPRALVSVTLPHSKLDTHHFKRRNGDCTLTLTSTNTEYGLPYGSLARLSMAWLTTQAVINSRNNDLQDADKPQIHFGKSFASFMKLLGLSLTGGRNSSRTRLREQMMRLLTTNISCNRDNRKGSATCDSSLNISRSYQLWWNHLESKPGGFLPHSKIILATDFFNEIVNKPVPVDFRALQALTKSPLQIDIYVWLTYRFSFLEKNVFISWGVLKSQFGSSYPDDSQGISHFKTKFKQAMFKVWEVYPEANIQLESEGVLLLPSNTHVTKTEKMWISPVDKKVIHAQTVLGSIELYA